MSRFPLVLVSVLVVAACGQESTPGGRGVKTGPGGAEKAAAPTVPAADSDADPGVVAAPAAPKPPPRPWPEKSAAVLGDGLKKGNNQFQEHAVRALVKTRADLKAAGLEQKAEAKDPPNEAVLKLAMNGWVSPDKWKQTRDAARAALDALGLLQNLEASPDKADRDQVLAKAKALLTPQDITEADLKLVHRWSADLQGALAR